MEIWNRYELYLLALLWKSYEFFFKFLENEHGYLDLWDVSYCMSNCI